jgi:hypothetical protein
LHSSFVTAADEKSSLVPKDFVRLAYDHFSTASGSPRKKEQPPKNEKLRE